MYSLVKGSISSPSEAVVRQWLKGTQDLTGTEVVYTPEIYKILVGRANHVKATVRKRLQAGGRQANKFLDGAWDFRVPTSSVIELLQQESVELQQHLQASEKLVRDFEVANKDLKEQVFYLANRQIKEAEGCGGTRVGNGDRVWSTVIVMLEG